MFELLAVRGIDKTSKGFRRKLVRVCERYGLNANYVASVIAFETGPEPFSPSVRNPYSGFVGLIQFGPEAAAGLNTTLNALSRMSAIQQLDYVGRYYEKIIAWKGPIVSLEDHYLAVIAPNFVGQPPETVIYREPPEGCNPQNPKGAYCQNVGLDSNGDGTITAHEATTPVRVIRNAALSKPRIFVDTSSSNGGSSGSIALFALATYAISQFLMRGKRRI